MPNSVQAAAKGMPNANRRTALALTATGIVAALGGMAATTKAAPASGVANLATPEPSPIMSLFREWDALYVQMYLDPDLEDDDEISRGNEAMKDLEYKIAALPAQTAPELAAKLIALSTFGEYGLDDFKDSVFTDARALIEGAAL